MQPTNLDIAVLLAIQAHPGADAKTIKQVAGLTPDHPKYMSVLPRLYTAGMIHACGRGWQLSEKGEELVRNLIPIAAARWDDHPVIRPIDRGRRHDNHGPKRRPAGPR